MIRVHASTMGRQHYWTEAAFISAARVAQALHLLRAMHRVRGWAHLVRRRRARAR
jgi:hypothetical protein